MSSMITLWCLNSWAEDRTADSAAEEDAEALKSHDATIPVFHNDGFCNVLSQIVGMPGKV